MARRKLTIQHSLGAKGIFAQPSESDSAIERLTEKMSVGDVGFRPTNQRVYEVNLDRISPDFTQPRRLLPYDLREVVQNGQISSAEAMQELVLRAERNDTVALLVLGGKEKGPVSEDDLVIEDSGLLALAQSIREVGLRHPLNVYRVDDPERPQQISYRLGEGERRFWAHHLLVQQGYDEFKSVKCIVEVLPDDPELIHQRQEAENAARVDLPAIARARSMQRIKDRLSIELGTRVPGENTIKLPGQRELQIAVGQRVKSFTGRAIGDRMVRNYLSLLNLSPEGQDLVEAAQLSEKQLRPVMRLDSEQEQLVMIRRIIEENWSGRQVLKEIVPSLSAKSTLREVRQTSVEQRFEKRVLDAAKAMYAVLTLPEENYEDTVMMLATHARDEKMRQAMQSLRQTLEEVLLRVEGLTTSEPVEISLISITPPLDVLSRSLPPLQQQEISAENLTGSQIMRLLQEWRQNDAIIASHLETFFSQVEQYAEALRADEFVELPTLIGEKSVSYPDTVVYHVQLGAVIYWAYEYLVYSGETEFKKLKAYVSHISVI